MAMHVHTLAIGATYPVPAMLPQTPVQSSLRPIYGLRSPTLQTHRLRLRRWESRDVTPFVNLCRDPEIMQFFNGVLSPIACFQEMERQEICFDMYQYGVWAVERKATGEFIGCLGLEPTMMNPKGMTGRLTWKLRRECWGMNYAYEAAMEVLDYAFHDLGVQEVFAPVHPANVRSLQLVRRLGLTQRAGEENCYYKSAE